jgi:hypothetical protein
MTTSSSSVPVLGPVLYFTSTDGYSYDVDNRPLFHLDTNIRHINTSLVGIGYGEHASLGGGLLSPGRVVSLFPNGSVFYPTDAPSVNPTANIVGLVIGATDSGLNRVIWSSKHLDLDVLGLSAISASQAAGTYLVCVPNGTGVISYSSAPNIATTYVVGRIKTGPYVEINTSTDLISNNIAITVDNAVKDNHANLYGLSRLRNLLLFVDAGESPIQFSKRTVRSSEYASANAGVKNPMNVILSEDRASIQAASIDTTEYSTFLTNYPIKEQYTQFLTVAGGDQVSCNASISTWSPAVYTNTLPGNSSSNYELQSFNGGTDYAAHLDLFKTFTIDKYYQYARTISGPTAGKVLTTATVFNPIQVVNEGGEATTTIVFDFFEYNISTGYESFRHRIILNGDSAVEALLSGTGLFPAALITI